MVFYLGKLKILQLPRDELISYEGVVLELFEKINSDFFNTGNYRVPLYVFDYFQGVTLNVSDLNFHPIYAGLGLYKSKNCFNFSTDGDGTLLELTNEGFSKGFILSNLNSQKIISKLIPSISWFPPFMSKRDFELGRFPE